MISKQDRIAIIGGGPAGLSLGMYLEEAGFTNYVIYEKSNEVGGKCCSPSYNGKNYELGALMGVPSYYAVHDVELFTGVTHDGPKMSRQYKNYHGEIVDPFAKKPWWKKLYNEKTLNQVKLLGKLLLTKYKGYDVNGHRGVASGSFEGRLSTPTRPFVKGNNPFLKDLALPFKDFCKLNHVPLVTRMWNAPFTAFGYGYFEDIPAAYVLKYLDFQTMMNFASCNLWTWEKGTQNLFKSLNEKLLHPARLNSFIQSIERYDEQVLIKVNGQVEEFDYVIFASPLDHLASFVDVSKEEKDLFSCIKSEAYDSLGVTLKDYPKTSIFIEKNLDSKNVGHLMTYYLRYSEIPDSLVSTYALRSRRGNVLLKEDECFNNVYSDLERLGNPLEKVIFKKTWYYFPHVSSIDYQKGWYQRMEALQGNNHTFYAGEVMSFGDMDEVVEYSRELVERFFSLTYGK